MEQASCITSLEDQLLHAASLASSVHILNGCLFSLPLNPINPSCFAPLSITAGALQTIPSMLAPELMLLGMRYRPALEELPASVQVTLLGLLMCPTVG